MCYKGMRRRPSGGITGAIIGRPAAIQQRSGRNLDALTRQIFRSQSNSKAAMTLSAALLPSPSEIEDQVAVAVDGASEGGGRLAGLGGRALRRHQTAQHLDAVER